MKKEISYKSLFLAITLTLLFFVIGIIIGNQITSKKYDYLFDATSDLRAQTLSLELQYDLVSKEPCSMYNREIFLGKELDELADKLEYLENQYSSDNKEVIRLKQYYSLLQIRHYLFYKQVNTACNNSIDIILYFYDNEECTECANQGAVLTAFRNKYTGDLKIYSFDLGIEDSALTTLKKIHSVKEAPTIIFNEVKLEGFIPLGQLDEIKNSDTRQ